MTTAISTKDKNTGLATIPEHLKAFQGSQEGKENIGQEDLLIPRLSVAQALSPQLKKTNEAYIPGLQLGDLFNTLTGENYGPSARIIPLFMFHQFFQLKPIDEGGGIIAQWKNRRDVPPALLAWGPTGQKPIATEFKCWMSLIETEKGVQPVVMSFKSTATKDAKKLTAFINMTQFPSYAMVYKMTSTLRTKGQQEWYGMSPAPDGFTPAALFASAKEFFDGLQNAGYNVDSTGIEAEDDTTFEGQTIDAAEGSM